MRSVRSDIELAWRAGEDRAIVTTFRELARENPDASGLLRNRDQAVDSERGRFVITLAAK
jgi:hypothetical protein